MIATYLQSIALIFESFASFLHLVTAEVPRGAEVVTYKDRCGVVILPLLRRISH